MAGLACSAHKGESLCQNFGLNCRFYHKSMIGRCVSQQLSQVIPSTPLLRKRVGFCQFFSTQVWVKIFRPQFLAGFSTQQPRWQNGEVEGFVSLNKIGLNFSTSTHICNYLISNMKHTLQNLCFGQRAFWVGWWASQERLKKISGVERSAAKSPKISPCPLNIYIDSLLRTFMANDIKFGSKDF